MTTEMARLQNIVRRMDYVLKTHGDDEYAYELRKAMKEIRDEIANAIKQNEAVEANVNNSLKGPLSE